VPKKKLVRLTHTHTNIETILKYLLQLTALAHVDKKMLFERIDLL